jgi:zinc protease
MVCADLCGARTVTGPGGSMGHRFELVERLGGVSGFRHRDNSLEVLVCPTPVAPVVSFGVVYRVGSRHETGGHTGATHLLEHLMFKGTERFNADRGTEVARVLQRVGANFNATTWLDRTSYFETLVLDHLDLAVDLEADRMRGALVRDADLERERTVVLNELDGGENEPFELLMKGAFAHAFVEHPYHHPTIGWRSDVESMRGETLRWFYDTFYHPDNATVVVAGDVTEAMALEAVERRFGAIPPAPRPIPARSVREPAQRGERRFRIHRAGEVGALALTWRAPAGLHPDTAALAVLTQVVADGVTSRLHQRLVETNRCLGVHAFCLELHDPGVFQVYATLAPGVPHDEVEGVIREVVGDLRVEPPTSDEVARAVIQSRTDLAFQRESPGRILSGLTEAIAMGDWRNFEREMERVEAVSADDLVRVAAEHLVDRNLTVGWFVPEGGEAAAPVDPSPAPSPCYFTTPFRERIAERALPGGARLVVVSNPHAPTVNIAGSLRAGVLPACADRPNVAGMTAAMLERGTRTRDRMQRARELEDHGLQLGYHVTSGAPSRVAVAGSGLAEEMPRLVDLLVDGLREPLFPDDELARLRDRVTASLIRERDDTTARAWGAFSRRLYPAGHPQRRRSVEERLDEVRSIERDELVAYHAHAYGPGSLVLAVVGDVDPDAATSLIAERLDEWGGGVVSPPEWPDPLPPEAAEELVQLDDRPNLDVLLGHAAELRRGDPDEAAAVLANACLGQSTLTSRLGVRVRDREGLTYGVYSRFFATRELPGPWAIALMVSPGNLRRAVASCRDVLVDYLEGGPGDDELADERTAIAGAYRVALATNSGLARELAATMASDAGLERLDSYPERVLATTRDDVVAALRRHIHPDRLVLAAAGSFAPADLD